MLRKIAVPALLVAGLVVGGASIAAAAPGIGLHTAECVKAVVVVKDRARAAVAAGDALAKAQAGLAAAQAAVVAARADLDAAADASTANPTDTALLAKVTVAADALKVKIAALVAAAVPSDLTTAAAKAEADLQAALDAKIAACKPITAPTSTQAPTSTAAPTTAPTTAPATTPAATTTAPPALYADCAAARDAGAAPINRGEPGYRAELDSDDDGIACELAEDATTPIVTAVPSGAVDTGWGA